MQFQCTLAYPKYFKPSQTQSPARFWFSGAAILIDKCVAFHHWLTVLNRFRQKKNQTWTVECLDLCEEICPHLTPLLEHGDWQVRRMVAEYLGEMTSAVSRAEALRRLVAETPPTKSKQLTNNMTSMRQILFWWFLWGIVAVQKCLCGKILTVRTDFGITRHLTGIFINKHTSHVCNVTGINTNTRTSGTRSASCRWGNLSSSGSKVQS